MFAGRLRCKRCEGADHVKSGLARGHQRHRCCCCGCHFTDTPLRGRFAAMKALAVLLYGMGSMSFSALSRILGMSNAWCLAPQGC